MSAVPLKLQPNNKKLPLSDSDKPYAVHVAGTERFYSRKNRFLSFSLGATVSGMGSAARTVSGFFRCRFLWGPCACTLSVIAIVYIVSQVDDFVKSKCEIYRKISHGKKLYFVHQKFHKDF